MARADWSRALPEPIAIGRQKLRTLRDIADFLQAMPAQRHETRPWQYAVTTAIAAAEGRIELRQVVIAFTLGGLHR